VPRHRNIPFKTLVFENYSRSEAALIAYGTNQNGHHEILGFGVFDNESKPTWNAFLQILKDRGLKDLLMITVDAHEGIQNAISKVFPDVPWQRNNKTPGNLRHSTLSGAVKRAWGSQGMQGIPGATDT
jgi:hypothetical protein